MGLKPRKWRGEAEACFIDNRDEPEAARVILYALPMDDEVKALEKEYLAKYRERFIRGEQYTHMTRAVGNDSWLRDVYHLQKCEDYLPFEKDAVIFEGNRYDTFKNHDSILQYQYGDYWAMPHAIGQKHVSEFREYSEADKKALEELRKKLENEGNDPSLKE